MALVGSLRLRLSGVVRHAFEESPPPKLPQKALQRYVKARDFKDL